MLELQKDVPIYTVMTLGNDEMCGFCDDTEPVSYLSLSEARVALEQRIVKAKETLDTNRYDTEERTEDTWEAYEGGYYSECFVKIAIYQSMLAVPPEVAELFLGKQEVY